MIDKEFLKQHFEMVREYQQEVQRLEQYDDSSVIQSPANIDGMPRGYGSYSDNTSLWVVRKTLLEENIAELRRMLSDDEVRIEGVVKLLSKANEKTVIRLRYINCLPWDDIVFFMYGDKGDYCDKVDYYKRKAQSVHGVAVTNMVKLQDKTS